MRVLDTEGMRALDRRVIDELGIPGPVLMENAALGVVDALGDRYPEAASAVVFCGPGNNGGDGLAVARQLTARGWRVKAVVVHGGRELSAEAALQLAACRRLNLDVREVGDAASLGLALEAVGAVDLVVDALFGTGLTRGLGDLFADAVAAIEAHAAPVVAVDLPSGLDAGRAEPPGPHVQADLTVTFAAPKVALLLAPAARAAGELVVADLGIPPWVVEEADGDLHLLLAEELAPLLAPRRRQAHKGDFGHLLLVAGSAGKAGAAILAARGAVRSGAGLVTVGVPEPLLATVDGGSLESMTLALPAREGRLGAGAVEAALAACEGRDALGMGPGLGTAGETGAAIRDIALRCPLPLLLDADAINAFAGGGEALRQRRAPTVLTPHAGELGRLLARATDEVVADRLGAAREAADRCRAVVVLKGHQTLVAAPEGGIWINPTGNPGLATGGTGDVLTGVLSALLAQGFAAARAAGLGAYVHGLAGDLAAGRRGQRALAAADLLDELGAAFEQVAAAGGGGVRRRCWRRIAG